VKWSAIPFFSPWRLAMREKGGGKGKKKRGKKKGEGGGRLSQLWQANSSDVSAVENKGREEKERRKKKEKRSQQHSYLCPHG